MKFQATLRMIWGLAKSPELSMSGEELHMFVEARTGKESLKELTQKERNTVARALMGLKPEAPKGQTGNPVTERQRQKLKELASEAGWDNPARLNGLACKMFGVERVEWLNGAQCSKLIEAMKAMNKRKVGENKEWNTKLISTESGEIAEEIVDEFQNLWNSEYALPYDDFYEVYKERYNIVKHQREIAKSEEILSLEKYSIS